MTVSITIFFAYPLIIITSIFSTTVCQYPQFIYTFPIPILVDQPSSSGTRLIFHSTAACSLAMMFCFYAHSPLFPIRLFFPNILSIPTCDFLRHFLVIQSSRFSTSFLSTTNSRSFLLFLASIHFQNWPSSPSPPLPLHLTHPLLPSFLPHSFHSSFRYYRGHWVPIPPGRSRLPA